MRLTVRVRLGVEPQHLGLDPGLDLARDLVRLAAGGGQRYADAGELEQRPAKQRLGYAEDDPTADVEGYDAAAKAAILASLAFHTRVKLDDVDREGITAVTPGDVAAAQQLGYVIKLLARCALSADGTIAVSVHPTMVPTGHPLANVSGAFNAVFIESRHAGQLMFMGPGAGGSPPGFRSHRWTAHARQAGSGWGR